jgi:hypothetical protein
MNFSAVGQAFAIEHQRLNSKPARFSSETHLWHYQRNPAQATPQPVLATNHGH